MEIRFLFTLRLSKFILTVGVYIRRTVYVRILSCIEKQQQFFQESSIQHILGYLRYIDPYGIPREDPESVSGRNYYIRVIYSDGSHHLYHQRADRYLRIDDGEWKRIDPEKALYLSGLLGMMPSEEPQETAPAPPLLQPYM